MSTAAPIKLENLSKRFGRDVTAVDTINLEVEPGTLFTLLGPSGCGKTTTLRMIAGLERASEGHIFIDNEDVTKLPANLRDVTMVFQSYALFPHMNVFSNVAYGLEVARRPKDEIKRRALEALAMVGLEGLENRATNALSGGQQQRVFLARSLAQQAEVFFFDEPFVGVDQKTENIIFNIFHQLADEGKIVVVVNHDLGESITNFDELILLNKELIASGDRQQVLKDENLQRAYGGKVMFFSDENN